MSKIVGIDLGTTNSLVAVWENGEVKLIPNSLGDVLTPSVVSLDEDNETLYVGKIAKDRLVTHPDRTASVFKRFMGTSKQYYLGKKAFKPEELSALVLKRLKADAEAYLGEPVEEAVISVPAYFNDTARNATRNAGLLAGLKVERIINEPSAAALAYQYRMDKEDATILVFDFGGGTLDVSLVDCFDNVVEILAVSGDNHLGGSDFDRVIADDFCKENDINFSSLTESSQAIILEQACKAKEVLTKESSAVIKIELEGSEKKYSLTKDKLVHISEKLFSRMTTPLRQVLADGHVSAEDLTGIVLVGGSCKMPIVQQYIKYIFGHGDMMLVDPDYMIAFGAGVYTGIKDRNEDIKDMLLTDICPFTLGVNVINRDNLEKPLMSPVIERNTALPASKSRLFYPAHERQSNLEFNIYQGEGYYADENYKLGSITIPVVPDQNMDNNRIDVRFSYDINGILIVDFTHVVSGEKKQLIIRNENVNLSEEEIAERIENLNSLKVNPREMDENIELMERAQNLFKQVNGNLKENLGKRIAYFEWVLGTQDIYRLNKAKDNFKLTLDFVEDIVYGQNVDNLAMGFEAWYEKQNLKNEYRDNHEQDEIEYKQWATRGDANNIINLFRKK